MLDSGWVHLGQWFATVCTVLMSNSDVFLQSGVEVFFARESSPALASVLFSLDVFNKNFGCGYLSTCWRVDFMFFLSLSVPLENSVELFNIHLREFHCPSCFASSVTPCSLEVRGQLLHVWQ